MIPQHIELVKSTVPVLRENGVALTSYFYNRMLNNHPELNNVFNLDSQSAGRQPRALAAAVLAYAENIENPSVLAKAIEHIAKKHVSLDIRADQYSIVGENLLHSISEVLNVPFESDLIKAWEAAYIQLADILIAAEKQKYDALAEQNGGWTGWRSFEITHIESLDNLYIYTVKATDSQAVIPATEKQFVSVKVNVPQHDIEQPHQFNVKSVATDQYQFEVKAEAVHTEYSVPDILISHYKVGDTVLLSAPLDR